MERKWEKQFITALSSNVKRGRRNVIFPFENLTALRSPVYTLDIN